MNATFKKMTGTIEELKTKLAELDGRRASFAAEHAAALAEKEKLEKALVRLTVGSGHPIDVREAEAKLREVEGNEKRGAAVLAGFSTERGRLQAELEQAQRALGDWLTGESNSWYARELKDYEKSLQAFVGSLNRLLAANHTLARHGGSPAAIFGRYGGEWTRLFGPALYSLQNGKAHRVEFGADQKTLDTVKRELLS